MNIYFNLHQRYENTLQIFIKNKKIAYEEGKEQLSVTLSQDKMQPDLKWNNFCHMYILTTFGNHHLFIITKIGLRRWLKQESIENTIENITTEN